MSKLYCFRNKFLKFFSEGPFLLQHRLTFNIGDLKLRDWAKLWIFKLIMKKSNFKTSVVTSF